MAQSEPAYGWVMVFMAAVLTGLGLGGITSIAVFLKPLTAEFGWQRAEVSLAYTVTTISTAVAGVYFGRAADIHGVRLLAPIGTLAFGVSLITLSYQTSLWHLYGAFAVFGGLGIATTFIPLTSSVSRWFSANRGFAVGAVGAGAAVCQAAVPFFSEFLLDATGWRDAFFYLGVCYLAIGMPIAFLARDPSPSSPTADSREDATIGGDVSYPAPPATAIAWMGFAVIFCCICMGIPTVHVAALVNDQGINPQQSAGVLSVVMIAGALGRVAAGKLADIISPLAAYITCSFVQTVAVLWFTHMTSVAGFYVIAIVFGVGFGGVMTTFLITIRSLVPGRMAGTAMSIVILFGWVGMGAGAYAGGLLFDWSGSYLASFFVAAIAGVINLSILSTLFLHLRRQETHGHCQSKSA